MYDVRLITQAFTERTNNSKIRLWEQEQTALRKDVKMKSSFFYFQCVASSQSRNVLYELMYTLVDLMDAGSNLSLRINIFFNYIHNNVFSSTQDMCLYHLTSLIFSINITSSVVQNIRIIKRLTRTIIHSHKSKINTKQFFECFRLFFDVTGKKEIGYIRICSAEGVGTINRRVANAESWCIRELLQPKFYYA